MLHTREHFTNGYGLSASAPTMSAHTRLAMGATPAAHAAGVTYVVTHADAIPSGKDDAITLLKQLAEASRNDDGG